MRKSPSRSKNIQLFEVRTSRAIDIDGKIFRIIVDYRVLGKFPPTYRDLRSSVIDLKEPITRESLGNALIKLGKHIQQNHGKKAPSP